MKPKHLFIIISVQILTTVSILMSLAPTIREKYVAIQTVELKGKVYVCGTVKDNQDDKSLYCTGFTDGYSWAVAQMNMADEITK